MSDEKEALVQETVAGIAARMRVDLSDGYRLAAKVALAALEPSDGEPPRFCRRLLCSSYASMAG